MGMPDLFRSSGVHWAVGAIGDSWYGVPVRIPVALVRAAALSRGGSVFLEDPGRRVQTLSGTHLTYSREMAVCGMVRHKNGIHCGLTIQEDSIGSMAEEAACRVYLLLSQYLYDLFGRTEGYVKDSASDILNGALLLVSTIPGVTPVSAQLIPINGDIVLRMTVRMDGVLEDIDVTVGGG
jgi:hypothetical protein